MEMSSKTISTYQKLTADESYTDRVPSVAYPSEVLADPTLTLEQKRAILASWLSDKHAVPDAPRWRLLEYGAFVDIEDIQQALYALDDAEAEEVGARQTAFPKAQKRPKRRQRWVGGILSAAVVTTTTILRLHQRHRCCPFDLREISIVALAS
jgi:hypothetical protein